MNTTLAPARLTVPPSAPCTLATVRALPSASLSLTSKLAWLITAGVSSLVEATVSLTASGASLTGVTLSVTLSVSDSGTPALSVDTTINVSVPLKFRLPR